MKISKHAKLKLNQLKSTIQVEKPHNLRTHISWVSNPRLRAIEYFESVHADTLLQCIDDILTEDAVKAAQAFRTIKNIVDLAPAKAEKNGRHLLGLCYLHGLGVAADERTALTIFQNIAVHETLLHRHHFDRHTSKILRYPVLPDPNKPIAFEIISCRFYDVVNSFLRHPETWYESKPFLHFFGHGFLEDIIEDMTEIVRLIIEADFTKQHRSLYYFLCCVILDKSGQASEQVNQIMQLPAKNSGDGHNSWLKGLFYWFGIGVNKDRDLALESMIESAQAGYMPAMGWLGHHYFNKSSFQNAEYWLTRAVAHKHIPSCLLLAEIYISKNDSSQRDMKKACGLYVLAAKNKVPAALVQLANDLLEPDDQFLKSGLSGKIFQLKKRDKRLAVKFLSAAANCTGPYEGHSFRISYPILEAEHQLCHRGVTLGFKPPTTREECSWWQARKMIEFAEIGATLDCKLSHYTLGWACELGYHEGDALAHYQKSSDLGFKPASLVLAEHFEERFSLSRTSSPSSTKMALQAFFYYSRAADTNFSSGPEEKIAQKIKEFEPYRRFEILSDFFKTTSLDIVKIMAEYALENTPTVTKQAKR